MDVEIRPANQADDQAIVNLTRAAFGDTEGPIIAELIANLLTDPTAQPLLSLVAETRANVVGHILFTHVRLSDSAEPARASILAPLAVHPDYQSQGIGGRLIQEGLRRLTESGVELVFVLGHPGYYPRHGFAPAGEKGLHAPYPIAPENAPAWMVQELRPGVLDHASGTVLCAKALDRQELWVE